MGDLKELREELRKSSIDVVKVRGLINEIQRKEGASHMWHLVLTISVALSVVSIVGAGIIQNIS